LLLVTLTGFSIPFGELVNDWKLNERKKKDYDYFKCTLRPSEGPTLPVTLP